MLLAVSAPVSPAAPLPELLLTRDGAVQHGPKRARRGSRPRVRFPRGGDPRVFPPRRGAEPSRRGTPPAAVSSDTAAASATSGVSSRASTSASRVAASAARGAASGSWRGGRGRRLLRRRRLRRFVPRVRGEPAARAAARRAAKDANGLVAT